MTTPQKWLEEKLGNYLNDSEINEIVGGYNSENFVNSSPNQTQNPLETQIKQLLGSDLNSPLPTNWSQQLNDLQFRIRRWELRDSEEQLESLIRRVKGMIHRSDATRVDELVRTERELVKNSNDNISQSENEYQRNKLRQRGISIPTNDNDNSNTLVRIRRTVQHICSQNNQIQATWRVQMAAGGIQPPRNQNLVGDGTNPNDNRILDAWFALTVDGGGNIQNNNLTAQQARQLWNNNLEAIDILNNNGNIRVAIRGTSYDGFTAITDVLRNQQNLENRTTTAVVEVSPLSSQNSN